MDIKLELEELISLFEKNYFVEAHDKTEILWRKYKNDEKTRDESYILKAFVNAFAFFELLQMQRFEHAKKIWQIYEKYENLIIEIDCINTQEYKKIKEIIYIKKEEIQK